MIQNKQGFSVIFVFFLIALVLSFGVVVINKQIFFEKKIEYSKIQDILLKNIITSGNLSIYYNIDRNKNNGTYQPFLSCPSEVSYFSGSELLSTGSTVYKNGDCIGGLQGENLEIFYNGEKNNFASGVLRTQSFPLTGTLTMSGVLSGTASISFLKPTEMDTRFIRGRTEINGIIFKNTGYNNIFWNNKAARKIIHENTNNIGDFSLLGNISTGIIYLDINGGFSGKIIEFNRNFYNNENKLLKVSEFNFSSVGGSIGYIQENGTISSNISTPKKIDLQNKDYAIFISYENGPLDNIRYQLKIIDDNNSKISYITPIKDDTDEIEYMGGNILLRDGEYISKIYKVKDYKINIVNNLSSCSAGGEVPCFVF